MNPVNVFLLISIFSCGLLAAEGAEARWKSKLLTHPHATNDDAFQAMAVSQDGRGNFLIAVEQQSTERRESSLVLFKADSSGEVLWMIPATKVEGIPFDISVDKGTGSAFVIVSESKRTRNVARAHIVRFTNIFASNVGQKTGVGEELFFSTPGNVGTTKFFGCVRHPVTSDLYVTGGTSAALYRTKSLGSGDAIVIRLGPSGQVLASAQFGSADNEVGRSIAMNADGSALVVVTKRQFRSGMRTSEIYRLDPQDLSIIDGPHSPYNHGANPLFNPNSIAIAGPSASQPNTLVTFVGGDALVKPDSQADIYIHIFTKIENKIKEITISFDGAKRLKGIDSCVSIQIGSDGNAYCLGYTEMDGESFSRRLNLIVVSPTGELLFESERAITGKIPLEETPTALKIVETRSSRKLVYVGRAKVSGKIEPTVGFIEIPEARIRTFAGFHNTVTGAGTVAVPSDTTATTNLPANPPSIPVIVGAAVGGLAVLVVAIAGLVAVERRRRLDPATPRTTRTTIATEDYTREVDESFNDAMTPTAGGGSRGALV